MLTSLRFLQRYSIRVCASYAKDPESRRGNAALRSHKYELLGYRVIYILGSNNLQYYRGINICLC
jgi:hypothetical protein